MSAPRGGWVAAAGRRLRWRARDVLLACGLGRGSLRARPGRRVMGYHGLDRRGGSGFNARFLGLRDFERQVAWLREHAQVVSVADLAAGRCDPARLAVALTFDDGYASVLDLALPVLERWGVPAACYVTAVRATGQDLLWTDALDLQSHLHRAPVEVAGERFRRDWRGEYRSARDGERLKGRCRRAGWGYLCAMRAAFPDESRLRARPELEPYWRLLDVDQLRRLARSPLVTIGSHGLRHLSLGHQPPEVVRHELAASKAWLEQVLEREVDQLAFPDGSFDAGTAAAARSLGYRLLLAGDELPPGTEAPDVLARLTANPFISWRHQMRCLLDGGYA